MTKPAANDVKKAFATSFGGLKKRGEPVAIDLHKIATHLVDQTAEIEKAEDPMAAVEILTKSVDGLMAMLDGATEIEGPSGHFVMAPAGEIAKRFEVEKGGMPPWLKDKVKDKEEAKKPAEKAFPPACEEEMDEEKAKAKKAADVAKADDSADWPTDMNPDKSPVNRSERLLKSERPIPARSGGVARDMNEKWDARRDKARGRTPADRACK